MNKFIASSLIGSTLAAPTALPVTSSFPQFPSVVAPATANSAYVDGAKNVLPTYQQDAVSGTQIDKGTYRGIRNDLWTFPTQTLTAPDGTNDQTVKAVDTGTRAYWSLDKTGMGKMWGAAAATGTTTGAQGASFAICEGTATEMATLATAWKRCNGGRGGMKVSSGNYANPAAVTAKRLVYKVGTTGQLDVAGNTAVVWTWNNDVLLASLPQVSWADSTAVTDGTKWCSQFKNTLPTAGTAVVAKAVQGLNQKSKCTWQFMTADGTTGPTMKFTGASYVNVLVQWFEFITTTALGSNGILPTADAAAYYIGAYPAADGAFINPILTQTDTNWNAWVPNTKMINVPDPSSYPASSVGAGTYYSNHAGAFQQTQLTSADSLLMIGAVNNKKADNTDFNNKANAYNTKKDEYNAAVTKENERLKDIFKAAFDPKVKIPTRPDPPSPPAAFAGPFMDVAKQMGSTAVAWQTTASGQKNGAYIKTGTGITASDFAAADGWHTRAGYINMASVAATVPATATTLASSGHIFGRFGQGEMTVGTACAPFYYGNPIAGNAPTLMISVFPNADTDTGLDAAAKEIAIEAKAMKWTTAADWVAPGQPSKPASPMDPPAGAAFLSVGLAASLVVASLY